LKIAVIGAGIFGVTIALKLSKKHQIHLYETANDILTGASRSNQLRLHRGYHYPRSPKTTSALLESISFFKKEYADAIIDDYNHYYGIANKNSFLTPVEYLGFCKKFNLEYKIDDRYPYVNNAEVALTIRVKESLLDYQKVYGLCKDRLKKSHVNLMLKTCFSKEMIDEYDTVINCTYSNINDLLNPTEQKLYQFEVCEKIAVKMPVHMRNESIVIMDGPFMCVDPYGRTELSLLGNVVHAIHESNVGYRPFISPKFRNLINKGIIPNPSVSNFDKFVKEGKRFIPSLSKCEYIGSMYTVRAVLPNLDKTDCRPTVISRPNSQIINVFSGKIDTCVMASKMIIEQLGDG